MKEIFAPLLTPGVKEALRYVLWLALLIYAASIVWVYRDASLRSKKPWLWVIFGVIPLIGPILYLLLRPPMYLADLHEQELEISRREREMMSSGTCPSCHYPLEADFLICPNCTQRVRNQCDYCGRALRPSWRACPYCRTKVGQ